MYIMVDVEADGPIPGDYSMISFGAVAVEPSMNRTFYGRLKPISDKWVPEALAVSGHSREDTLGFNDPKKTMEDFAEWLSGFDRPRFISDNNGFDWMFVCWYFHHFTGGCPFGFSSSNLGSLYKGIRRNMFENFKRLRQTKHSHHPVDDAKGNVEAMFHMVREMRLKI